MLSDNFIKTTEKIFLKAATCELKKKKVEEGLTVTGTKGANTTDHLEWSFLLLWIYFSD